VPRLVVAVLAAVVCCTSCTAGSGAESGPAATPEPSVSTLTPIEPPPTAPPTGRLLADIRQSSRDAALGRMEVWIGNDTRHDVTPTRIRYTDPRFRRAVPGERLRLDPSRSERGYPLALPSHPACGHPRGRGRLRVTYDGRTVTLPVTDDNDVVARYVASRCLELAVDRVADLRFADRVPVDRPGEGSTGTLVLVARPTGVPGHVLRIDSVGGTPLLGAADTPWRPRERVRSDGQVRRIELPVRPARCDDHVFMESAGATAFLVALHLDGRPGSLVLRMSPTGASAAIAFARDSCGL
jgi:hypothetical protein